MANGDIYIYDSSGNLIEHKTPPDTRSVAEKALSGTANFAAGVGRVALDAGDGALTLLGQNYWDGDDQGSEFVSAWAGLGKTALAVAAGPDFGVEPLIDIGLPSNAELAEVRQSMLNDFIAKDDFQNGDIAYGAGKVFGNLGGALLETKGAGTLPKGATTPRPSQLGRADIPPVKLDDVKLPEITKPGQISPDIKYPPHADRPIPESVMPRDYNPYGNLSEAEFMRRYQLPNGRWEYPDKDGFVLDDLGESKILDSDHKPSPGTGLDRIGEPWGAYLAPEGTPMTERALPPHNMGSPYYSYEVSNIPLPDGWRIEMGMAAEWFGQKGGGIQYRIVPPDGFDGGVITGLLDLGYLIEKVGEMKQEYTEDQVDLLGRVVEFWRLMSVRAEVNLEPWVPPFWSDEFGVELNSEDPETSYYITKDFDGYRLQRRTRARVTPTTLLGRYEDAVKSISFILGSELRSKLRWGNLYNIWSDSVPVGVVVSDQGDGLIRYSLGVDPSRFVQTRWKGPQQSRLLPLTIDEMHAIILTPPPSGLLHE